MLNNVRSASIAELQTYFTERPAEINSETVRGITPLLAAIASGRPEVVELFLQLKANPDYTSARSTLPLIFAIDSAVEADDYDGAAALTQSLIIIRLLLHYGASPHVIDVNEGQSPTEYAVGRLPEVKSLFEAA